MAGKNPDLETVRLWTDGACKGNPGPGGYGTVLLFGKHRKELSGGFRKTTNNRMELLAAIVGFEALKRPCKVEMYTDSSYVRDGLMTWAPAWRKKNWRRKKNQRVVNWELWKRLLELYEQHEVTIQWVRGHSGVKENERCDELASNAALGKKLPADAGYESPPPMPPPLSAGPDLGLQ